MNKHILWLAILLLCFAACPGLAAGEIALDVQTEEGSTTNIDFGRIKSLDENGDPVTENAVRTVILSVTNTSGKQFQVTQRLNREILNEMHVELAQEALTFFTFGASTAGRQLFQSPQPVSSEEEVIFISDSAGTNDSFRIQYTITNPTEVRAGRYSTNIIYKVTVIE